MQTSQLLYELRGKLKFAVNVNKVPITAINNLTSEIEALSGELTVDVENGIASFEKEIPLNYLAHIRYEVWNLLNTKGAKLIVWDYTEYYT